MPANTIYVGRPTKWGNPWTAADMGSAAEAVRRFRCAVLGFEISGRFCPPDAHPESTIGRIITEAPRELRGKNLAKAQARYEKALEVNTNHKNRLQK